MELNTGLSDLSAKQSRVNRCEFDPHSFLQIKNIGSNIFLGFCSNSFICIDMKAEILKLRSESKTYSEIQKILKCSKGTISYHCGDGQKEKHKIRLKNYKKTLNGILKRKKDNFTVLNRKRNGEKKRSESLFSSKEFKTKLINNPICYLTGRKIDLLEPKTYNCDHMIPVSKNGGCEIENLGLTCKEANMAKGDLLMEDFISLCKEVLMHNGYMVEKRIDI